MCYKNKYRDMTLKTIFQNVDNKFSNNDFSVDNESNVTKSLGFVHWILLEGSVSQNFDLGPIYFFMLCRNLLNIFFHYFFYVLCHKNKTMA